MDKLAELLIDTINSVFGEDKFSLIFYLGIFLISILLFKEFKNKISEESRYTREQLDIALKVLLDLKFGLVSFKATTKSLESFGEIKAKILAAFPYLSIKLSEELQNININIQDNEIDVLLKDIETEINGLKNNQDSSIVMMNNYNVLANMSYIYRTRLHTIFVSTIMTLMTLLFILIVGFIYLAFAEVDSVLNRYYFIQMLINLMVFFTHLILIANFFQEEKIKNSLFTWIYVPLSLAISIVLLTLYTKWLWLTILHFVLLVVMIWLLKKILK
ncbi:MAG: hypothetical protein ABS939_17475 [Psychrobacillus sp.]